MNSSGSLLTGIPDLVSFLQTLGTVLTAMTGQGGIITTAAAILGAFYLYQTLTRLHEISKSNGSTKEPGYVVAPFIYGVLLVNFWATQQSLSDTFALTGGVLSPAMPAPYLSQAWTALQTVLVGFGYLSVFRGLIIAKNAGDGTGGQNSTMWGSMWHIIGGILLINFL